MEDKFIKTFNGFLSHEDYQYWFKKSIDLHSGKDKSLLAFKTNYYWNPDVVIDSAPVLIHTLYSEVHEADSMTEKLISTVEEKLGWKPTGVNIYYWTQGAHIPWHEDPANYDGLTVYLNDFWDGNYGGTFLYQKDNNPEDIRGIIPSPNLAVWQHGGIWHRVEPTSRTASTRVTLQIWNTK